MSTVEGWNPSGHPVHRLIQYLDAAITAFNAFTAAGRIPNLLITDTELLSTNSDAMVTYWQLDADYHAVTNEIFVKHYSGPSEVTRMLEDACVAHFARAGRTNQEEATGAACQELGSYFRHSKSDLVSGGPARFLKSLEIRNALVSTLARIGEVVPEIIRRRLQKVNMEDGMLPTTVELLKWVTDARPSAESPRPTEPARKGKGKKINSRMLELLTKKGEAFSWSATQWATHLKCAASTVKETSAWKNQLTPIRASLLADRKLNAERRKRGY